MAMVSRGYSGDAKTLQRPASTPSTSSSWRQCWRSRSSRSVVIASLVSESIARSGPAARGCGRLGSSTYDVDARRRAAARRARACATPTWSASRSRWGDARRSARARRWRCSGRTVAASRRC